jgi:hypothetical protein
MAVSKETERITISLDKEVKEKLDEYAKLYDIPTSRIARNMVYVGLDQVRFLHLCGFGHVARGLDKFKELFQNLIVSEEEQKIVKNKK